MKFFWVLAVVISFIANSAFASEKFCNSVAVKELFLDFNILFEDKHNIETSKNVEILRSHLRQSLSDYCKSTSLSDKEIQVKMYDTCFREYNGMKFSKSEKITLASACYGASRTATAFLEGLTSGNNEECEIKKNSINEIGRNVIKATQVLDSNSENKSNNTVPK